MIDYKNFLADEIRLLIECLYEAGIRGRESALSSFEISIVEVLSLLCEDSFPEKNKLVDLYLIAPNIELKILNPISTARNEYNLDLETTIRAMDNICLRYINLM